MTSEGTIYEIRHPDLVMVGLTIAVVGQPDQQQPDFFSNFHIVSIRHIVRLEIAVPTEALS